MNKTPLFLTHAQEQRLLSETMARIRERNRMQQRAAWMAEVVIATAQGKVELFGWPMLEGGAK